MTEKPRCGSCLWYERATGDGQRHGLCLVEPPVLQIIMPPPSPVTGKVQPALQGLRPPTAENDRCRKWHSVKVLLPLSGPVLVESLDQ